VRKSQCDRARAVKQPLQVPSTTVPLGRNSSKNNDDNNYVAPGATWDAPRPAESCKRHSAQQPPSVLYKWAHSCRNTPHL
jgi:hypothetical protein